MLRLCWRRELRYGKTSEVILMPRKAGLVFRLTDRELHVLLSIALNEAGKIPFSELTVLKAKIMSEQALRVELKTKQAKTRIKPPFQPTTDQVREAQMMLEEHKTVRQVAQRLKLTYRNARYTIRKANLLVD